MDAVTEKVNVIQEQEATIETNQKLLQSVTLEAARASREAADLKDALYDTKEMSAQKDMEIQ
eukprot:11509868-Karenia_brevis.AAC.1